MISEDQVISIDQEKVQRLQNHEAQLPLIYRQFFSCNRLHVT